jgi:hypothetical protein
MASRPPIPERYSSIVPPSGLKDMEILSKRTASAMTAISQLSTTSSTNDFLDAKIESISADLAFNSKFKDYFENAKKRKALADEDYDDAVKELELEVNQKERELITLRRQKKIISDDIDEVLPQYSTVEGAYSSVLMAKIMSASGKQRKERNSIRVHIQRRYFHSTVQYDVQILDWLKNIVISLDGSPRNTSSVPIWSRNPSSQTSLHISLAFVKLFYLSLVMVCLLLFNSH